MLKSGIFVLAIAALTVANLDLAHSFSTGTITRLIKSDFLHSSKLNLVSRRGAADTKRTLSNQLMCNARGGGSDVNTKWEFSRFASTFTFFNGNPLGRIFPFLNSKTSLPRPLPKNIKRNEIILWDFASLSKDEFRELMAPLDDVVMGGVSQSTVALSDDGAFMAGATSSRNNGGFCSCRTRNVDPPFDLTGYDGVAVRLRSDVPMRYKLILRDAEGWDTVAWCHSFDLPAGQWTDVRVPFPRFVPVVRGNTLPASAARALDAGRIFSVQFMVSKYEYDGALNPNFTEGPFRLDFGPVRAYSP